MSTRDQSTFGMNHPTVIPTNFDPDGDRTIDAGDRSTDADDERPG